MSNLFNNRVKYHTASRVASQSGEALLQALTIDGHTVSTNKVWASNRFPENTEAVKKLKQGVAATKDLVAVFKGFAQTTVQDFNGGKLYKNPNYDVELYENVLMSGVAGSNGSGQNYEAFEILDANNTRVIDWVSPMAAFDKTYNIPIPGFTGIVQGFNIKAYAESKGKTQAQLTTEQINQGVTNDSNWLVLQEDKDWTLAKATWEFAYLGGMLIFDKDFTPAAKNYTYIRMTAFKYVGKYLDKFIDNKLQWQIL